MLELGSHTTEGIADGSRSDFCDLFYKMSYNITKDKSVVTTEVSLYITT